MATTLKARDKGELVKRLQAALISLGYDLGPSGADGKFGDGTKAAVKNFQAAHSLSATGVADPDTIAAMDLDPDTLEGSIQMDQEDVVLPGSSSEDLTGDWAADIDPFPAQPTVAFHVNNPDMTDAFAPITVSTANHLCAALVDLAGNPAMPPA